MDETQPITTDGPQRQGRWFDQYAVGDRIVSAGRTVTEGDIHAFAALSGDFNPLHVDEAFAARSAFRSRIAHGLLVESLGTGLAAQTNVFHGTIAALAGIEARFVSPVRAGDTLHIELEVVSVDPEPSRSHGRIRFQTRMFNQRGELVCDGHWDAVVLRERRRARAANRADS